MMQSEVTLAIVAAVVVLLGSVLICLDCCKVAGDCSKEEEKRDGK